MGPKSDIISEVGALDSVRLRDGVLVDDALSD